MESHPFAIFTASDRKYGDFLIDHWLGSLTASVDLSRLDVCVLDYGLSTAQRYYLRHHGVRLFPCVKDGHVAVVRFRDMARVVREHGWSQVLAVDGGDIVFQDDVAPLFDLAPDRFRAVEEDLSSGFGVYLREDLFSRDALVRIRQATLLKPQINAGFLLAPRDAFLELCDQVTRLVLNPRVFGPDQLVVNAVLHERGYHALPSRYNFVVATVRQPFVVERGRFLLASGEPVAVVHNAGNWKFLRPVDNFGFGEGHNRLKPEVLSTLRLLHQSSDLLETTKGHLRRLVS